MIKEKKTSYAHMQRIIGSNASRLLNNSTEYCDNFLTVNVPFFKSLLTRIFSPQNPEGPATPFF